MVETVVLGAIVALAIIVFACIRVSGKISQMEEREDEEDV